MAHIIDPLAHWLSLTWDRPERSYNPDLREFFAGILDYPKPKVVTEDAAVSGYPDIKLMTPEGFAWVVGDMKKDDAVLTDPAKRAALWHDKRKYIDGLTRFVPFLTPHYLWVVLPTGAALPGFETPLDLRTVSLAELKARLSFLSYGAASHARQWQEFTTGTFPFSYLTLDDADIVKQLRADLRAGFLELTRASVKAMTALKAQFDDYGRREADLRSLDFDPERQRRARMRLERDFEFVRRLFGEALPQFEDQYGRDVEGGKAEGRNKRIEEAFIADSVAALMARVLFLRLVEDLGLTKKRRLSDGGPKNWAAFVEYLTGDARALVRVAAEDVKRVFPEPFGSTVFDWIHHANGELDESLQRFILRLNAYNFSGLSEELLGDIYQQFLPPQKRKQLGEYYTPPSIVDWILDRTVQAHGLGAMLDPSCGSGSCLVRHAHRRLEDAARRNLDRETVRREVQEEVWGFDLNPFAAFISLFQITWALLRFHANGKSPQVHVYNLNSLLKDTDIAPYVGEEHLPPGSMDRDARRWKYIVGNPPYIRGERSKWGGEMRDLWKHIWGQNSDAGLVFLYRALTEWLEPGGFLGMVVSGGYANTEAAAKVWSLLYPGGSVALRKVVWLEFIERNGKPLSVWDAARVPLILIIERVAAQEADEIELYVPSSWPSEEPPSRLSYQDFFDKQINQNVTNPASPWGDYLLPLLRPEDAPLLRRLYPDGEKMTTLGSVVKWTYGIQRGGVEVTEQPVGERPVPVIAGRSLAVAWPGVPAGWVDLSAVEQRPNGKPSLWRHQPYPKKFLAVAKFGLAGFASIVTSEGNVAALDTATIASEFTSISENGTCHIKRPEAIAAFINSSLARYYWAVKLRAGVLEGSSRATFYPRSLSALPWPKNLSPEQEQRMADGYDRLAELAARAKDNPNEWLLAEAERRLTAGSLRLTEPALGLRFGSPDVSALPEQLQLDGRHIKTELLIFAETANVDLAEYLYRLLTLTTDEEKPVTASDVQKLVVPKDYPALMGAYRARWAAFQTVETDFRQAMRAMDDAVYDAFGITTERAAIEARLAGFPLNRLKPRFPWETVRPRAIKAYMEDRY